MKTLTREQYFEKFKELAEEVNTTRESAISFYQKLGVLTPTGRLSRKYRYIPENATQRSRKK